MHTIDKIQIHEMQQQPPMLQRECHANLIFFCIITCDLQWFDRRPLHTQCAHKHTLYIYHRCVSPCLGRRPVHYFCFCMYWRVDVQQTMRVNNKKEEEETTTGKNEEFICFFNQFMTTAPLVWSIYFDSKNLQKWTNKSNKNWTNNDWTAEKEHPK